MLTLDWLLFITLWVHSCSVCHNVCRYTVFQNFWFNLSFTTICG